MNQNPDVATKIKYQSAKGDQVELEFDPSRMIREEIAGLVDTLKKG
jgi:hypothetical protein